MTKSENDANPSGNGGAQVVASSGPAGPTCTQARYGVPKLDLKDAVVGFSQPEKRANPFRIAETQSTNAQSQLSKQISDVQDMPAQGAQFLIVAPLNSAGLEPALQTVAARKVPMLTIDGKVNAAACEDYLAFLGSNFVEQGKRVPILPGSFGNNVTTDRTNGFVDQIKAKNDEMALGAGGSSASARWRCWG